MGKPPSKHDPYFKAGMSHHQVAVAFFERFLPPTVRRYADLSRLSMERESFVDERLKVGATDVLFSVPIAGRPGYFYLLVGHQSEVDPLMAFRLRHYVDRIMAHHLKQHGGNRLVPVFPMVFYKGKAAYRAPTNIKELFDAPDALVEACLDESHQVIDLGGVPGEDLKGNVWFTVFALLLKHIFDKPIRARLLDLVPKLVHRKGDARCRICGQIDALPAHFLPSR